MDGERKHSYCLQARHCYKIDIAQHMIAEREKLSKGMKRTILVDVRNILSIEDDARKFFASEKANHLVRARAILHNHVLIYLTAKVFLLVDEPSAPTKIFTEYQNV